MWKQVLHGLLYETPKVSAPGGGSSSSSGSGTVGDKDTLADDLALLNDESDEEETEEEDEESEKKDESETELDEGEEETEEETEETDEEKEIEKEDEKDPVLKAASYKAIKTKYPNFFKEFPGIKNDIFAVQAYRAVFASTEEAKDAAETVEAYNNVQAMVVNGETDKFLNEIKEIGGDTFKNFAGKFLPALYSTDKDLYYSVATPVIRGALRSIVDRGKQLGGKIGGNEDNTGQNLINAAIVAHLDIFGNTDIEKADAPVAGERKADDPERKKLDDERSAFLQTKYNDLHSGVNETVRSTLIADIKKGLDPNNSLSSYVRDNLVRDIFVAIDKKLGSDEGHLRSINALWAKEQKSGFTGVNRSAMINLLLSRARPLIPAIRQRLRSEALRDAPKRKVEAGKFGSKEGTKTKSDVKPGTRDRKNADFRSTSKFSDLDIINS